MIIKLAIAAVGAAILGFQARRLAAARGRSPVLWPLLTVAVGAAIFAFEEFFWARPSGDAAAPAGLDMQTLLPLVGMAGTALLLTYLPDKSSAAGATGSAEGVNEPPSAADPDDPT